MYSDRSPIKATIKNIYEPMQLNDPDVKFCNYPTIEIEIENHKFLAVGIALNQTAIDTKYLKPGNKILIYDHNNIDNLINNKKKYNNQVFIEHFELIFD
jgi:hypothetical protein